MTRFEPELRWFFQASWTMAISLLAFIAIYYPARIILDFIFITVRGE